MVRVKTRDGREIEGMRINEDPVSIQIRDMRDGLHSFEKAELASIERLAGRTPMPSYAGKLTETELEDVVAYLQGTRR
jgi:mono/diheme cytochrome c family protein